ncbi:MAG TPA: TolC family protein [Candidatus Krumholzibacteria bacterium]|nr:TolC family protein [Candidatus Krumholzibacteria bacterium]
MKTHITLLTLMLIPVLAAAGPVDSVTTAAPEAGPATLVEYLELARGANPSLQASRFRAQAARERIGEARGFPDPSVLYGYWVAPDAMQGRQEIVLMQQFPFFGKRGLRGDVAASAADVEASGSVAVALDVDAAVKMSFYDYVRLYETERVLVEEAGLLARMRDAIQVRYAAERAQQQDVLKVTLAISQLDDQLTVSRRELAVLRARLNELIGRDASAPLPPPQWTVPEVEDLTAEALVDTALARRPEMAAARAEVEMAERMHRLAKKEYIPDFMLGAMYEFGADQEDTWELMAGINLPLWLGKRKAGVRAADAMRTSAGHRLRAEELRARRDVSEAVERVRAAEERRARFETVIVPQAEQTFQSSEAGYRSSRVDFLDYLDSERTLLSIRREYYAVIADLGVQIAALERAVAATAASDATPQP